MKILVVGDYPPPHGGLSVQVSVLRSLLAERPGYVCRVLDIGESRRRRRPECLAARNGLDFAAKLFWHAARGYLIHLHTSGHNRSSWLAAFACAVAGLANGRKSVLSIGSGQAAEWLQGAGRLVRGIARLTLALTAVVICRNERTRSALVAMGVAADKLVVLSGFYGLGPAGTAAVPAAVEEFLRRHSPVVGAVASIGPEYGLPLVAEATVRLRARFPELGLLLFGPASFEHADLDGNLLVAGELPHPTALAVMRRMHVFVRPTYFDGDASSVREALALNVPVVASDTDFRPDGVILFQRGRANDLTDKLAQALDRGQPPAGTRPDDARSWSHLQAIYERLSADRSPRKAGRLNGDSA
jgi:glycosyltransferase involved in cell wall biosynthesis